jgi:predicted metal-dependent peptidase
MSNAFKPTLDKIVWHLTQVKEKAFYAALLASCERIPNPGCGKVGIGIRSRRLILTFDPDLIGELPIRTGAIVLEHEAMHVVLDHVPRYLEFLAELTDADDRDKAKILASVAMDLAVNCILRHDPEYAGSGFNGIEPEKLAAEYRELGVELDVPPEKSFEYYLKSLMEHDEVADLEFLKKLTEQLVNSHGGWAILEDVGDIAEVTPTELKSIAKQVRAKNKQMLRKLRDQMRRTQGLIPGDVSEWLDHYLVPDETPWWHLLDTKIKGSKPAKFRARLEEINPGMICISEQTTLIPPIWGQELDRSYRVLVWIDTSGSVSKDELGKLMSMLEALMRVDQDMEVRLIQGDTNARFDRVYTGNQNLPREAHGRGGTDFDAYFRYMKRYVDDLSKRPDLIIVATDGGCSPVSLHLRFDGIPLVWLLTVGPDSYESKAIKQSNYGEIIHMR